MTQSGNVVTFELPFDAEAEEATVQEQRYEEAKGEIADEVIEQIGPPPELQGVLEKYGNDPVKLASAYRALQQEFSRVKGGAAPTPEAPTPEAPAESTEAPALPDPAVVAQMQGRLFEAAGGQDRFAAVQQWVVNNSPPGRITAYNQALQEGRADDAITFYKSFQYDYLMSNGFEGRLVGGRSPRGEEARGFSSEGEMVAAMADPRYSPQSGQYDEGFHKSVHARIAASGF
jgi:hypothetical protein